MIECVDSPESSSIASATYDTETEVMVITFRAGRVYEYPRIPRGVWDLYVSAQSKGTCFSHNIRPLYVGRRV